MRSNGSSVSSHPDCKSAEEAIFSADRDGDVGGSPSEGAARAEGISSAIRWIARAKIGERTPRPQGRRRASSLDAHEAFIFGLIEERKDITLNEMVEGLQVERSVRISRSALSAWLRGRDRLAGREVSPPIRGQAKVLDRHHDTRHPGIEKRFGFGHEILPGRKPNDRHAEEARRTFPYTEHSLRREDGRSSRLKGGLHVRHERICRDHNRGALAC